MNKEKGIPHFKKITIGILAAGVLGTAALFNIDPMNFNNNKGNTHASLQKLNEQKVPDIIAKYRNDHSKNIG